MANEIVGLKIQVDSGEATKSVGSLKAQLREAQADVTKLSEKFGATSKEAVEAAKRAADLRDRIGDARALTDAFNPDAKFRAFTATLSGVAGGFAAVQGALGLVGVESDKVEKTLLKVQSAMAI
jgi:chromosome segregation ATPase